MLFGNQEGPVDRPVCASWSDKQRVTYCVKLFRLSESVKSSRPPRWLPVLEDFFTDSKSVEW